VSTRLDAGTEIDADVERVWEVLVDWQGQERWIPLTTLRVLSEHEEGLGVRVSALSGFWLGRLPVGLLDNFVVTGWSPPRAGEAELEILHLGPYFTGEGVFHLSDQGGRTRVSCTELITVPGGPLTNALVRLMLPLMRLGFGQSLGQLAAITGGGRD
jgi:uncharacterized protein YndB with AHSA1/START domain